MINFFSHPTRCCFSKVQSVTFIFYANLLKLNSASIKGSMVFQKWNANFCYYDLLLRNSEE